MAEDNKTARQEKAKEFADEKRQENRDKKREKANKALVDSVKVSIFKNSEKQTEDKKKEIKETQNFFTRAFGDLGNSIGKKLDEWGVSLKSLEDAIDKQWGNLKSAFGNFASIFTNNPIFAVIAGAVVGIIKLFKWIRGNGDETVDKQEEGNSWLKRIYNFFTGKEDADLTAKIEAEDRHEELIRLLKEQGSIFGGEDEEKMGFFERFQDYVVAIGVFWGNIVAGFVAVKTFLKNLPKNLWNGFKNLPKQIGTFLKNGLMRTFGILMRFLDVFEPLARKFGQVIGKFFDMTRFLVGTAGGPLQALGQFFKKLPIIGAVFGVIEGVFFDATRIFGEDVPFALRVISGGVRALTGFFLQLPAMVIDWFGGLFGWDLGATELVDIFTDELIILFKNMFDLLMGYITGSDVVKEAAIKGITEFSDKVMKYFSDLWYAVETGLGMLFEYLFPAEKTEKFIKAFSDVWDAIANIPNLIMDMIPDWAKKFFKGDESEEAPIITNPKKELTAEEEMKAFKQRKASRIEDLLRKQESGKELDAREESELRRARQVHPDAYKMGRAQAKIDREGEFMQSLMPVETPLAQSPIIFNNTTNAAPAPQAPYASSAPKYARNNDDSIQAKWNSGMAKGEGYVY